jgi:hypothetical protein
MGHVIELASLSMMLVFLAVALSIVGFGVSKLLHLVLDARRQDSMNSQALYVAAKSRADRRSAARA